MVTRILHKPEYSYEQTISAYDQIIDEMKQKGISAEETRTHQSEIPLQLFFHARGRTPGLPFRATGLMHPDGGVFHYLMMIHNWVNSILGGFMEGFPTGRAVRGAKTF